MKIYDYLATDSPYTKDAMIQGIVYQVNPNLGVFVAVDGKYHGMIPKKKDVYKRQETYLKKVNW